MGSLRTLFPLGFHKGSIAWNFIDRYERRFTARTSRSIFSSFHLAPVIELMLSGFGASMFSLANNSVLMRSAHLGSYGGVSGLLRTLENLENIGALGSFVVAISVTSASIPRFEGLKVFIWATNLTVDIASESVVDIGSALWISVVILAIARDLSAGRETTTKA